MSAAIACPDLVDAAQDQFEAALPAIDRTPSASRSAAGPAAAAHEAIADARAAAWHAWHGLLRRGKDPLAVGVDRDRRQRRPVRHGTAAGSAPARAAAAPWTSTTPGPSGRRGFTARQPRPRRRREPGPGSDAWREWLAEDNRVTPADEACFRVDFAGVAGGPARPQAADGRAAGRGARHGRGGAAAGRDAGGGQHRQDLAGGELAGVPGRDGPDVDPGVRRPVGRPRKAGTGEGEARTTSVEGAVAAVALTLGRRGRVHALRTLGRFAAMRDVGWRAVVVDRSQGPGPVPLVPERRLHPGAGPSAGITRRHARRASTPARSGRRPGGADSRSSRPRLDPAGSGTGGMIAFDLAAMSRVAGLFLIGRLRRSGGAAGRDACDPAPLDGAPGRGRSPGLPKGRSPSRGGRGDGRNPGGSPSWQAGRKYGDLERLAPRRPGSSRTSYDPGWPFGVDDAARPSLATSWDA